MRLAAAMALLIAGTLVSVYGLFAILYNGDGHGSGTYVTWAGEKIDADIAGAIALLLGLVLLFVAWLLLKWKRALRKPL